jgi:tripartite ATP-independent transporter DctM subunit
MITVAIMARLGMITAPRRPRATMAQIIKATKDALPCMLIPIVLLGGIFSGQFTPTEAGAVAVFLALILALIYGEMTYRDIPTLLINGALASGKVAFLIAAANIFGWIVTREKLGHTAYNWIIGLGLDTWAILLLINLLFFIAGLFIEGVAILMISVPVFVPVLPMLGIHPVTFGVLVVLLNMIGFLTPPVGVGTYIAMELAGARLEEVMRSLIPLLIPLIIMALLITYWPPITLAIPRLIFGF